VSEVERDCGQLFAVYRGEPRVVGEIRVPVGLPALVDALVDEVLDVRHVHKD